MNRFLDYHITNAYSGYTLGAFLTSLGYPARTLTRFRKDASQTKINGLPAYLITPLKEGDLVHISIIEQPQDSSVVPKEHPLTICYEDEDLIVINKPPRMPVHPSLNNYTGTLANALAYYYAKEDSPFTFRCINRLDRDTSGLTIVAKNPLSAAILNACTESGSIHKVYRAITLGLVSPTEGTICAPIGRKAGCFVERCVDLAHGETAVTHYKVLSQGYTLKHNDAGQQGFSEVSLTLETGRTHQIRVHMAHLGFPLIGDFLYNPTDTNLPRQALHAEELTFPHPITKEQIHLTAPLPADMQQFLDGLLH